MHFWRTERKAELKEAFPSLSAFVMWYPRRLRWREKDFLMARVKKERPVMAISVVADTSAGNVKH